MVLFVHNRYRTTGGEERVVGDLLTLVRERLHEPAELIGGRSADLSRARAAGGLLAGGLRRRDVEAAVRRSGARVVHAHNLQPEFGWRALAGARSAGARVVLHLHQYRLVCAVGVCFTRGEPCTRCHGRNTLPGIIRNCRGNPAEALVYGASLSLWQPRMLEHVDAVIVPSAFAAARLLELGAPLPEERLHVLAPPVAPPPRPAPASEPPARGGFALVVSRLAPEKGVDVAIDACRQAEVPLVIAGDGPERGALTARARGADVRFLGRIDDAALARLRAEASVALVPSRSGETFGAAAAEAMAAGLPVAASSVGALPELLGDDSLVPAGDARALAQAIARLLGDPAAGERARERVRAICAPELVASRLARIYDEL